MRIEIICNEKGTGKTTFAKKEYFPHVYFTKDTISVLEEIDDSQYLYCIIDSVDSIPTPIFSSFMNKLNLLKWKSMILLFDIVKEELVNCLNFNMIWQCGIIPRNYTYQNFKADVDVFHKYLQNNYPEMDKSLYNDIIKITDYNFEKIDRLMLLNHLHANCIHEIDIRALTKYTEEIIQKKYKDIPHAEILLQKASIIGEQFSCDALESPDGFNYETASAYIRLMAEMHGFIKKCIDVESKFEFISYDVYRGIFNGIKNENKIHWVNILIQYYIVQYERCANIDNQISLLNRINSLYKLLPSCIAKRKSVSYQLFYLYRKNNQVYKALEISEVILNDLEPVITKVEKAFIQNYQIKTCMNIGDYNDALKILVSIQETDKYPGSKMLIKFYYAQCLFQTGKLDLAYTIVSEIVDYLKSTSGSNTHSQELFSLTYSLMATIQHHIGVDDEGIRYFHLALNHASTRLENKVYYYDIIKKCDMFYNYKQVKENLERCRSFYEQHENWISAGEVCINLATEMLFQDCAEPDIIKSYFENAISYFLESRNEKFAYAKNNYGIYCIMVENNVEKGLNCFKEALLIGLSDFTYMCIYLNICMCYLLLNRFESDEFTDAYLRFKFAKKRLNQRQHASKYENVYEKILNIIIEEYQGKDIENSSKNILNLSNLDRFFVPLIKDILKRNRIEKSSYYDSNVFFYTRMNQLRCFLAEFRFWE